jgi:hypothetical protein
MATMFMACTGGEMMRLRAAIKQLSAYALMRLFAVETRDLERPEPAQISM